MKKHRFPDGDEWNKIVDDAFSSDEVHVFSEKYNMEKQSMRKGVIIMKKRNTLMNLTVAAAAFAVIAFPTGIYLSTHTAETPATDVATPANNETIYALEMGWLPDGFEQLEENEEGICYGQNGGEAEITVLFLKNTSDTPIEINPDSHIVDTAEAGTSDDRSFVINYNDSYDEELADPNVRGRRAMVTFDGTDYLARLIVTDSISKDDLNKIINEMKLVPSDTETAKEYQPSGETIVNNETFYALEMGWLPEGLEYQSESEAGYCYGHVGDEVKVLAQFMKNTSVVPVNMHNDSAVTTDVMQSDDRYTVINYYSSYNEEEASPENTGREVFVSFKGTDYFANIIVTDDISKDDLKKIIDEIKLVPSDTETAQPYHPSNLTAVEVSDGIEDGEVNEEVHQFAEDDMDYDTIYDVEYGWLPEGLEFQDEDSPYGRKFHNWTTDDGMTQMFYKIPKGTEYYEDTGNPEIATTKTEFHIDGKNVSMYYRSTYNPDNPELNFGRIAFIYFDNTPYVLELYVTDGISEEDFSRIIENVKLVPSDTETAQIYQQESGSESNVSFDTGSYERLGTAVDEAEIVQVGDEIYEKYPDSWGNVTAKVTGVRFDDDFNGLTTNGIGIETDYSDCLDEDGKLIEDVRTWYKNGSINDKLSTETVPISVMTVVVTYTNNGTTPVDDYCVCPTLQTICDGYFFNPSIYNKIEMENKTQTSSVDYRDTFRYLKSDDMHFSFSCDHQSSKNNISLAPRETAEVVLAYVVEDKFRDNLYLSMNDNGFVDLSNLE